MPIRAENRHHYRNQAWGMARHLTLLRSRNRCEFCDAPNGAEIVRDGASWLDESMTEFWRARRLMKGGVPSVWVSEEGVRFVSYAKPMENARRRVRIVLTVAHLDHDPANNSLGNLRALCQRCHNRHDAKHRAANAARTRAAKKAVGR